MAHAPIDEASGTKVSPLPEPRILHTPPQIFGAYGSDGSPLPPNFSDQTFTLDQMGLMPDESMSEAKRRRIARVRDGRLLLDTGDAPLTPSRRAICVARRRSSAMASYRHALIV